jgi:predicted MPP superfamily phosphohydrolase
MREKWKRLGKHLLWLLCAIAALWLLWGNLRFQTTRITLPASRLPAAFDGYTIALVSDLHNHPWGEGLTEAIRQEAPDLIALCGDLIDSFRTNTDTAAAFAGEAVKIAPVYYVTGNHEARAAQTPALLRALEEAGVTVLNDAWQTLSRGGETIRIAGLRDPACRGGRQAATEAALRYVLEGDAYTILLSHRPELLALYTAHGADLVLTGHAHGGQVRLPWLGGLVAPDQGLFPRYTEGVYRQEQTAMVVSRGLGNSVIPIRVNNPPELVILTLECAEE